MQGKLNNIIVMTECYRTCCYWKYNDSYIVGETKRNRSFENMKEAKTLTMMLVGKIAQDIISLDRVCLSLFKF